MKSHVKQTLCKLYRNSGILAVQETLRHWMGRTPISILLFHRVSDDIPEDGLTISRARFRALCQTLERGYRVVSLGEIFRLVRSGAALPRRTVAITFDDCYRDNLDAAHVLHEHGLPATFFVPTGFVGTGHVFPWDRRLPRMANLTWDEVDALQRLGFEIGSHTVTHPDMGSVTLEQATREILESKAILEQRLGEPVRWFAYPFGGVNNFRPEWLPLLRDAGYEGCVSAYDGLISRGMETAILPRVPVPSFATEDHLAIHLSGCLNGYHALKRRLGLSEMRLAAWEIPPYLQPGNGEEDYVRASKALAAPSSMPTRRS